VKLIEVIVLRDDDPADTAWMKGVAAEWLDELGDPRQDICSLEDGQPVNAGGVRQAWLS
jgi:hypothetical protein